MQTKYADVEFCLQILSANYADMHTHGYAICIFTEITCMLDYTYLLLPVSYKILRIP